VLRRVLGLRPDGAAPTESELESRFVQCLRCAGVAVPERQHPVRLSTGRLVRLDLAWPADRLFAELDGRAGHEGWEARRHDLRRQTDVVVLGWRPLRFSWEDVVGDPAGTAERVQRALVLGASAPETGA
jgi:very-short-patch-repair endonuclease